MNVKKLSLLGFISFKMVFKVGINGFGRIGRVIFRKCLEDTDLEVKAINDPAVDIEYICYLIKFDSTHGRLNHNITFSDNEIKIDDGKIKVFHEKSPSNIPWQVVSVQYVVEASGIFTNYEKASGHLSSPCVKRVLVTAPSIDVPMLIIGVNEDRMKKVSDQKVISCASSTLYCLAPIIKILEDNYRVVEGYITSIHAMTPSLKPLDGLCLRGKHWRDHRSIHQNIIPAATGACKALGKIIPGVRDKLTGLAFRVPVVNVSVLDITVRLVKSTSILDIVKCIDDQGSSTMKNVIKTCRDEAVSSDFLGEENSCILDIKSCLQLTPNFFKLICWYENEYSYACRVIDSIKFFEKISQLDHVPNITNTRLAGPDRLSKSRLIPFCNRDIYSNTLIQNRSRLCLSQNTVFKQRLAPTPLGSRHLILHNSGPNQSICNPNQITKNTQDISPLFQKCVFHDSSDREIKTYLKTQERLEEVKKEFSKMVDMTEKLLNTSKNSKLGLEYCTPKEKIEDKVNKTDTLYKGGAEMPLNSCSNNLAISKEHIKIHENDLEIDNSKNKSLLNEHPTVSDLKTLPEKNLFLNVKVKAVETIDKTVLENKEFGLENVENLEHKDEVEIHDSICVTADSKQELENKIDIRQSYVNEDIDDTHFSPNNKSKDELEINESCSNSAEVEVRERVDSKETLCRSTEIKKKIIEGIIKKLSKETTEETNKINLIYTNSSISNNAANKFNDIYDKLDSTSATDSENSFQIHERKSQVIEMTDLTNSVEDLARLDKICRIIEISDELSDRLFSALDNNQQDYKRKKWSFKDLCENIKLDEFCNKVFGS